MDRDVRRGLGLLVVAALLGILWLAGAYPAYGVAGLVLAVVGLLLIARNLLAATD